MILAAGLSPAWQQIVVLDKLHQGEVNRACEVHWCASGKVINVAMALHHLCEQQPVAESSSSSCRLLTLRGGLAGDSIEQELAARQLSRRWVHTSSPTRICTTLLELDDGSASTASSLRSTTEIVENANPITADELVEFVSAFTAEASRSSIVVLTGSLPTGVPGSLFTELIKKSPARVIVDVQGPTLAAACAAQPFLVKPNREELGRTLGRSLQTDQEVWQGMQDLQHRGAQSVLVTEGSGPIRLCIGNQRFQFASTPVSVVNPIGCGDCLAAGIAWGLATGSDLPGAVKIGIAAAAENARQLLPARLNRDSVRKLAEQIAVQTGD